MTIALWCVLAALVYPYFFTVLAKSGGGYNNKEPRAYLNTVSGWHQRANAIQQNSFEVHPAFASAVIIATMLHAEPTMVNKLAVLFILSRIAYGICYLANAARLRSLCFFTGAAAIVGLFYISA